jgi:hypothetical protein
MVADLRQPLPTKAKWSRRPMSLRETSGSMRELCRYALSVIVAFLMTSHGALSAPRQLYGKSVIVTWQEDRRQSTTMDAQPTSITASAELSVYISDIGRPFSRVTMNVSSARGSSTRMRRTDAVQGDGSARSIGFSGSMLNATMPRGDAGAMQVSVSFDASFQSCSARVITGKAGGAQFTKMNAIRGGQVEVYSVRTSGEGCRVQNGNVFGGG